jgi:hypothetical protein
MAEYAENAEWEEALMDVHVLVSASGRASLRWWKSRRKTDKAALR